MATTVPLVRPAWITSSSAANRDSMVTAESIVPVSFTANSPSPSWPSWRPPQGNRASWVMTTDSSTSSNSRSKSRSAMAA